MKKSEKITAAILTMAIGVLLIALKGSFIGIIMTISGACLIISGILDVFHGAIPPAVIKMVAGLLIIICGWVLVGAVLYIVSAILLIAGILLLYDKIKKKVRCDTGFSTVLEYAMPSLCILIGSFMLLHQAMAIEIIFIFSGILTLLEGGVLLTDAFLEE